MALIEIKKGLGTQLRGRKPIVVWHVVQDGRTIASGFGSLPAARNYVERRFGRDATYFVKEW